MSDNLSPPDALNPSPHEATAIEKPHRRNAVLRIILLVAAFGCFSVAAVLMFFAEAFATYTPYSVEKHWMIVLPNGTGMWFDAQVGMVVLIASSTIGVALLIAASVSTPGRRTGVPPRT